MPSSPTRVYTARDFLYLLKLKPLKARLPSVFSHLPYTIFSKSYWLHLENIFRTCPLLISFNTTKAEPPALFPESHLTASMPASCRPSFTRQSEGSLANASEMPHISHRMKSAHIGSQGPLGTGLTTSRSLSTHCAPHSPFFLCSLCCPQASLVLAFGHRAWPPHCPQPLFLQRLPVLTLPLILLSS